jgi:gliding motility-associated-like protein
MKKIFTLITVCLLAQASFAQNIINISAPGLNCAGDQTTITVETDYTNPIPSLPTGLTYNLLSSNSILGPWSPWPGQQNQPFTTAIFDIVNIQSSHWMVEIMDAALVITDFEIISITSIPSFDFVPAFPATVNDIGCNGDNDGSIELWLQGGTWPYDFNWVGPAGYVNNQLNTNPSNISGLAAGTYTCIAIDDNGCSFDGGPIQYTIIDPPALDVSNTSTSLYNGGVNVSCFGEDDGTATVTPIGGTPFTVGAAYTYLWWNGSSDNPINLGMSPGNYNVTVIDGNGCEVDTAFTIATMTSDCVPNVFSPNGDGINDSWSLEDTFLYAESEVRIYGRFGRLIFQSVGYHTPWDGTNENGKDLPDGVYFYHLEIGNGFDPIQGTVTIIR